MFNLDQSIAEWRRQMGAGGIKSPRVLDELESHLRDDVEQQMQSGLCAQRAFTSAVKRIGQATALGDEFDRAGNNSREIFRRHTLQRACAVGAVLFMVGASLCYFMVIPAAMRANSQYASWLGIESHHWPATLHVGFVCKLMFGVGLGFAMPVTLAVLVKLGVVDYRKLIGLRRYVIVLNLIVGALMTTPEVVTQLLMFIPLQLAYELGVCLAWYSRQKENKPA